MSQSVKHSGGAPTAAEAFAARQPGTLGAKPRWEGPKPRLVFFRLVQTTLPTFVNQHLDDHVRCLGQFFDVSVVSEDADYDKVCDRLRPDLALFESGVYVRSSRRIRNTATHPDVPKLGLLDADAYCVSRSVFLADMDEWGVGDFVTHSVAMSGHTPDIADSLFSWPNFADSAVYHSYPGGKTEQVLLSGSRASNYPWRTAVDRVIAQKYPVKVMPHGGWFDPGATAAMPVGSEYARGLSAALIVPTCGTMANELVRKHLEIPASGALLLTERTAAVEAAGFVDGENCVFADEHDVAARLENLFANPDDLRRIAEAGQQLARNHHDIDNRDQIRQWYELTRHARSEGSAGHIVQPGPFAPLELAPSPALPGFHFPPGRDQKLIQAGSLAAAQGDWHAAIENFETALRQQFVPEAALGMARAQLSSGRPEEALAATVFIIEQSITVHGAKQPDPVEWATLIRVLLGAGRGRAAVRRARQYPKLRHLDLDRMRAYLDVPSGGTGTARKSVHVVPLEEERHWRASLLADLAACSGQRVAGHVPRSFHPSKVRRFAAAGRRWILRRTNNLMRR